MLQAPDAESAQGSSPPSNNLPRGLNLVHGSVLAGCISSITETHPPDFMEIDPPTAPPPDISSIGGPDTATVPTPSNEEIEEIFGKIQAFLEYHGPSTSADHPQETPKWIESQLVHDSGSSVNEEQQWEELINSAPILDGLMELLDAANPTFADVPLFSGDEPIDSNHPMTENDAHLFQKYASDLFNSAPGQTPPPPDFGFGKPPDIDDASSYPYEPGLWDDALPDIPDEARDLLPDFFRDETPPPVELTLTEAEFAASNAEPARAESTPSPPAPAPTILQLRNNLDSDDPLALGRYLFALNKANPPPPPPANPHPPPPPRAPMGKREVPLPVKRKSHVPEWAKKELNLKEVRELLGVVREDLTTAPSKRVYKDEEMDLHAGVRVLMGRMEELKKEAGEEEVTKAMSEKHKRDSLGEEVVAKRAKVVETHQQKQGSEVEAVIGDMPSIAEQFVEFVQTVEKKGVPAYLNDQEIFDATGVCEEIVQKMQQQQNTSTMQSGMVHFGQNAEMPQGIFNDDTPVVQGLEPEHTGACSDANPNTELISIQTGQSAVPQHTDSGPLHAAPQPYVPKFPAPDDPDVQAWLNRDKDVHPLLLQKGMRWPRNYVSGRKKTTTQHGATSTELIDLTNDPVAHPVAPDNQVTAPPAPPSDPRRGSMSSGIRGGPGASMSLQKQPRTYPWTIEDVNMQPATRINYMAMTESAKKKFLHNMRITWEQKYGPPPQGGKKRVAPGDHMGEKRARGEEGKMRVPMGNSQHKQQMQQQMQGMGNQQFAPQPGMHQMSSPPQQYAQMQGQVPHQQMGTPQLQYRKTRSQQPQMGSPQQTLPQMQLGGMSMSSPPQGYSQIPRPAASQHSPPQRQAQPQDTSQQRRPSANSPAQAPKPMFKSPQEQQRAMALAHAQRGGLAPQPGVNGQQYQQPQMRGHKQTMQRPAQDSRGAQHAAQHTQQFAQPFQDQNQGFVSQIPPQHQMANMQESQQMNAPRKMAPVMNQQQYNAQMAQQIAQRRGMLPGQSVQQPMVQQGVHPGMNSQGRQQQGSNAAHTQQHSQNQHRAESHQQLLGNQQMQMNAQQQATQQRHMHQQMLRSQGMNPHNPQGANQHLSMDGNVSQDMDQQNSTTKEDWTRVESEISNLINDITGGDSSAQYSGMPMPESGFRQLNTPEPSEGCQSPPHTQPSHSNHVRAKSRKHTRTLSISSSGSSLRSSITRLIRHHRRTSHERHIHNMARLKNAQDTTAAILADPMTARLPSRAEQKIFEIPERLLGLLSPIVKNDSKIDDLRNTLVPISVLNHMLRTLRHHDIHPTPHEAQHFRDVGRHHGIRVTIPKDPNPPPPPPIDPNDPRLEILTPEQLALHQEYLARPPINRRPSQAIMNRPAENDSRWNIFNIGNVEGGKNALRARKITKNILVTALNNVELKKGARSAVRVEELVELVVEKRREFLKDYPYRGEWKEEDDWETCWRREGSLE